MAHARHRGAYLLLVHGADTPTDREWDDYLRDAEQWLPETTGQLVLTDGGGPTSGQRRALKEMLSRIGHPAFRTAVLSSSLLARGIVLAINLFTPRIRAFQSDATDEALDYVRALRADRADLIGELTRMHADLLAPP
jgi:hypothetical protein